MSYKYTVGGTYKSRNTKELEDLRNKYIDQSENYDPTKDNAYQEYASMMRDQGNKAMESAMARASANSGGYGNSYAQTVGQQVLNDYSREIGAAQETYYDRAMNKILNQMNMLENREAADQAAWEQDYLNAISDAQKAEDYDKLAQIYGFKDAKEYKDSLRTALPAEEIDKLITAMAEGNEDAYLQYLDDKNYNIDDAYLDASGKIYSGEAGVGRILAGRDADGKATGYGITSNTINSGIRGTKDTYQQGEKFHVSIKGGKDYYVKLGSATQDSKVTQVAEQLEGEGLFVYDGKLYHAVGNTVHEVVAQSGKDDDLKNLIKAIRADLKKAEE